MGKDPQNRFLRAPVCVPVWSRNKELLVWEGARESEPPPQNPQLRSRGRVIPTEPPRSTHLCDVRFPRYLGRQLRGLTPLGPDVLAECSLAAGD